MRELAHFYGEINRWAIPSDIREVAEVTARACSIDLGIPSMDVRWVRDEYGLYRQAKSERRFYHLNYQDMQAFFIDFCPVDVFIVMPLVNYDFDHVRRLIAHECRHAWQHYHGKKISQASMEQDCDEYAGKFLKHRRFENV